MCGRYTITQDLAELEKIVRFIFGTGARLERPRYNLAPRQIAPVLIWEGGTATLKPMRWGLIPSWAKDETMGDKLTNARAETVTEKASYRRPFQKQRCLIPADGFYEWQTTPTGKQPFRFTRKDGGFFCMAGLWEKWIRPHRADGRSPEDLFPLSDFKVSDLPVLETFTVITTTPNAMVAKVHDRMPVILGPEHFQWWLEPERFDPEFLKTLLRPYPAEEMDCCRVSRLVNSAKNDGPECLAPG